MWKLKSIWKLIGTILLPIFVILLSGVGTAYGQVGVIQLPLVGAKADTAQFPNLHLFSWALSSSIVLPEAGSINHNNCVIAANFGAGANGLTSGIYSAPFTVERTGNYRIKIEGTLNGQVIEGSSGSITGVSKSGGLIYTYGGFIGSAVRDTLYETDFGIWAYLETAAWASIKIVLDNYVDGSGTVSDVLLTIKDLLTPNLKWENQHYIIEGEGSLLAGADYKWGIYVASSVGAGAFGDVQELALFEASITDITVTLEYLDDYDIVVSDLDLIPSTVKSSGTFEVSGTATYSDGFPVSDGTASINIEGGNSYSAVVENGEFSHLSCKAPENPYTYDITRAVTVNVSDGVANPGQASQELTIRGRNSGNCFTLHTSTIAHECEMSLTGVDFPRIGSRPQMTKYSAGSIYEI